MTLLADRLARELSALVASNLRAARIESSPSDLGALLRARGLPELPSVIALEELAGGAALQDGRVVGAGAILTACPWIGPKALPRSGLLPVVADPILLSEDWEAPVGLMDASGSIHLYAAPSPPVAVFASFAHLLEVEALAPLERGIHHLRVDALVGDIVASLVGAAPHEPAMSPSTKGFVGSSAWVKELRVMDGEAPVWDGGHGTFLLTADVALVRAVAELLLDEGHTLGWRGPRVLPPPEARAILSFVDVHSPHDGAPIRVTIWDSDGSLAVTRAD